MTGLGLVMGGDEMWAARAHIAGQEGGLAALDNRSSHGAPSLLPAVLRHKLPGEVAVVIGGEVVVQPTLSFDAGVGPLADVALAACEGGVSKVFVHAYSLAY